MTTYTHAVVGLGLGYAFAARRAPLGYWLLAGLLPVLPDLDVFSLADYGNWRGHRGFTHSLAFALAVAALAAGGAFRYCRRSFGALCGIFFVITASHGLLDAFTRGGAGIPFFWPFSDHRWGGWGPVPVPDIGFELPDPRASRAVRAEFLGVWVPTAVLTGLIAGYRWLRRAGTTPAESSQGNARQS